MFLNTINDKPLGSLELHVEKSPIPFPILEFLDFSLIGKLGLK